jgi:hypothetical protein
MMRNIWFPKKMAEYLTADKLQELGVKKDATVERDPTFRSNMERKLEKQMLREEQEEQAQLLAQEAAASSIESERVIMPHVDIDLISVWFYLPSEEIKTYR